MVGSDNYNLNNVMCKLNEGFGSKKMLESPSRQTGSKNQTT